MSAGDPLATGDEPFDLCGPLPDGVTVLEASAGTGKTFTIAGLAARYVAAGVPLERLLLVTFTRAATGELRDRVRERLVSAEAGLDRVRSGAAVPEGDDVLALLASGSAEEVATRHRRLARALADFDAATITTTHGFCQHVLGGLGVAGDTERDVRFLEDPRDLVDEIVDDLYVRRFAPGVAAVDGPALRRRDARAVAELAITNPDARLEPRAAAHDTIPAMRRRLAEVVLRELDARKRAAGVITYDDLLTRLAETLADPSRGPAAKQRLRQRYRVALVDEFQDTDPIQWAILQRVFDGADTTLVLIGDPKQAIFAFRGADVYAYLTAAERAERRATLAINWRSDQGLLDALDAVFGNARLGHPGIPYRRAQATEAHRGGRLVDAPCSVPLRIRTVRRGHGLVPLTSRGAASAPATRELIAADVARDLVALLESGARVVSRHSGGADRDERVRPGHVAVLVARHKDAALVRGALENAGIPAVINGVGSVFSTSAAEQWLRLLEALERPTSTRRARLVAISPFLGWRAPEVDAATDSEWETIHVRLHRWAHVLRRHGVASLFETLTRDLGLPERLLEVTDGERTLTDLRHVAELLHSEGQDTSHGATTLAVWLRQRIEQADGDAGAEERSRRLESDAEAVQVLTVHRSKGLEFPLVYCPFLWSPAWMPDDRAVYHDESGQRAVDVGGKQSPRFGERLRRSLAEQRGEELRLAYVALTRARHQAVVWWAPSHDAGCSPLGRLLFGEQDADGVPEHQRRWPPEDDEAAGVLEDLAARAPGCVSVEIVGAPPDVRWQAERPADAVLGVAPFERTLDRRWGRTSYSGIVARAHEPRVASEPEEPVLGDEPEPPAAKWDAAAAGDGEPDAGQDDAAVLLAAMPGGTRVGTFVHEVLEATDFAAPDLATEVAGHVASQRARRHVDVGDPQVVVDGLCAAIRTPLGPLTGGLALRDVTRADRLDELAFELPLVGGDAPAQGDDPAVPRAPAPGSSHEVTPAAIAALLARHLPEGDPLAAYVERLDDPALRGSLRGYLVGSIDLVLRLRDHDGEERFAVVDYKTNRLGGEGETLTAWRYRPAALAEAMHRAHYPLQALLYEVALHRYLRWRLPDYEPDRRLAGVLYLFLRGMGGPGARLVGEHPYGVFSWRPPVALITELSDLLDRGAAS